MKQEPKQRDLCKVLYALMNQSSIIGKSLVLLADFIRKEMKFDGMCLSLSRMRAEGRLTQEQHEVLHDYLKQHRPRYSSEHWWTQGIKEFRLDWLIQQVIHLDS